jgi:hypothetical protein
MRIYTLLVLLAILLLAACGTGGGDFEEERIWQQTFTPGETLVFTLDSGSTLTVPGTTFNEEHRILFSDLLEADDAIFEFYPTTPPAANDLLAGVVINTPVDAIYNAALPLTMSAREYLTNAPTILPNTDYAVYRFDFEENRWNRWGGLTATTNATGSLATLTLPTNDFMGFLGTLGIFEGHTVPALGNAVTTYVEGNTLAIGGNAIGTDVAVYQLVGEEMHPVDLSDENPGARIPALADPRDDAVMINVANVVDSDPATGYFQINLPWELIGTIVRFEFGRENAGQQVQDEWVIDYPLPFDVDDRGEGTSGMTMAYGRNTISPLPILGGS